MYEDGHIRGEKNEQKAARYYKYAAEVDVPQGNYCYAIALVFGWLYATDAEKSEKRLRDRKSAIHYLNRIATKFPDAEEYVWEAKDLLKELRARNSLQTKHFECNKEERNDFETKNTKEIPFVELD